MQIFCAVVKITFHYFPGYTDCFCPLAVKINFLVFLCQTEEVLLTQNLYELICVKIGQPTNSEHGHSQKTLHERVASSFPLHFPFSIPSFRLPSSPFPFPLIQLEGPWERCKLPQQVQRELDRQRILCNIYRVSAHSARAD